MSNLTWDEVQEAAKMIMKYNDVDSSKIPDKIKAINIVPHNDGMYVSLRIVGGGCLSFDMPEEEIKNIIKSVESRDCIKEREG